jgi:hypothetical protein
MKRSFNRAITFLAISSIVLLAVTSCSKSNNSSSSTGVSATVSGTAWANSYPVAGIYYTAGGEFDIIGAQMKGGDTTGIEVFLTSPITLNSAVNTNASNWDLTYIDEKTLNEYDGAYGNSHALLTVTSYDSTGHKIGGTFTGVLYNISGTGDSIVVTNGKFNTAFQVQ